VEAITAWAISGVFIAYVTLLAILFTTTLLVAGDTSGLSDQPAEVRIP
jgi:hypothetical protein